MEEIVKKKKPSKTSEPDRRARLIERGTKIVMSSHASHLTYCHRKNKEGKAFHKRCAKEYAELIKILSQLY